MTTALFLSATTQAALTCLEDGTWSGDALVCEPLALCSLALLVGPNAEARYDPFCAEPYDGTTCVAECTDNFFRHVAGGGEGGGQSLEATCNSDGQWVVAETGKLLAAAGGGFECGAPLTCPGSGLDSSVSARQRVGPLALCSAGEEGALCEVECASSLYTCGKLAGKYEHGNDRCWDQCGKSPGPCPSYCGVGSCCRRNYGGCSSKAIGAHHSSHLCTYDTGVCPAVNECVAGGGTVATWGSEALACVPRARCPDLMARESENHASYGSGTCSLAHPVCAGCTASNLVAERKTCGGNPATAPLGWHETLEGCARACHETVGCVLFGYGRPDREHKGECWVETKAASEAACNQKNSEQYDLHAANPGECAPGECSAAPFARDPPDAGADTVCTMMCPAGFAHLSGDKERTCKTNNSTPVALGPHSSHAI